MTKIQNSKQIQCFKHLNFGFVSNLEFRASKTKQKGFTLIEAVVATAVFAFVVSSIIGVYMSTIQLDRKTRSQRAVAQNARFIMEYLAKEVRNGSIYYSYYPGGVANSTLALTNQANQAEYFYLSGTDLKIEKGGATTNLNSDSVRVTKLLFRVSPAQDPYTTAKTFNEQPKVTVIMELTSDYGGAGIETSVLNLQSTFATRNYPSRE